MMQLVPSFLVVSLGLQDWKTWFLGYWKVDTCLIWHILWLLTFVINLYMNSWKASFEIQWPSTFTFYVFCLKILLRIQCEDLKTKTSLHNAKITKLSCLSSFFPHFYPSFLLFSPFLSCLSSFFSPIFIKISIDVIEFCYPW